MNKKPIITAIALTMSHPTHADITSGLVAYYPFNGNANDASGNGNNGTVYGATLTADRFGNANSAYSFNGVDSIIRVTDNIILQPERITIAAWINANSPQGWARIVDKYRYNSKEGYNLIFFPNNNAIRFDIWGSDNNPYSTDTVTTVENNHWHHIAVTYDNSITKIFYDGILENTITINTPIKHSARYLSIGNGFDDNLSWPFSGNIDEVRIYNRALTAAEITELYQEGTTKQLTITKTGTGNGTVTSNPDGINCAAEVCIAVYPPPADCQCTAAFPINTNVTLTATPAANSTFNGFSGDADCTDKSVTMNADKTCIATFTLPKPIAVTNPASNITQTSATLNGNVISTGATATTSFDFGTTTTYGTNIAATPSQVYSSTAVAINANNTDLACNTTYNFRTKAINSAGTGYGTNQSFTTAACVVNSWLYPANLIVTKNQPFALDVIAKSDGVSIGNYEFVLTIDPNVLRLDTTYCNQGICPGTSALTNNIVYANTTTGVVSIIGQGGETPSGNDLQLLKIHFKSRLTPGLTPISLVTNKLATLDGDTIGLGARGATVAVSPGLCGDADGNNAVNIVDALAIARKLVGLPPPPTIDEVLADVNVNKDGVSIADALQIARYSIGLLLPPEVCKIGQPLSPV
jgi:hypothetical protein